MTPLFTIKSIIKRTPLGGPLRSLLTTQRLQRARRDWEAAGKPIPPPHAVKQFTLRSLAGRFGLRILVETGTCHGQMLEALKHDFKQLYSIELSESLHAAAIRRFRADPHVHLIRGDSGEELEAIVSSLSEPALFWLDGHYSGGITARGGKDTPVLEELDHIFRSEIRGHIIVIDDARCFGSDPSYPTLEQLEAWVVSANPTVDISVDADSIRLVPRPC